ncbi:hypothetical protein [Mucilaginibacter panaciglaebae]|uniref:Uncharacterized protein n=1 Tax=Mucilaginibacter panaciglaebae TaxID=502331 RepID=A0ABP7X0F0_9SPHI
MNPFFDISTSENLPPEALPLNNLGNQRIMAMVGRPSRNDWGGRSYESNAIYTDTVPEDYDDQFAYKLNKWKPVYDIDKVINHHYDFYLSENSHGHDNFLKHMRYVILPKLKSRKSSEACIELFEKWLDIKMPNSRSNTPHIVNNSINLGNINAPVQFQQNSENSVQTQYNYSQKDQVKELFNLLTKDIEMVNEKIRSDFAMEMNYAVAQLAKDKDIKPQLLSIGGIIKDVGIGTFTNLLASPIYEIVKPMLGL